MKAFAIIINVLLLMEVVLSQSPCVDLAIDPLSMVADYDFNDKYF